MPPSILVELVQHDPIWAEDAQREAARLSAAIGKLILVVHHIGSTAIPGIRAKPILDLIPVLGSLSEFDGFRPVVERLGYSWWGEYGLAGRRYCTLDDPSTGKRRVQLHCYQQGSPEIVRHLAFRDYLLSKPDLAREYDLEKGRCRDLHPSDSHAYGDCKSAWIRRIEAEALAMPRKRGEMNLSIVLPSKELGRQFMEMADEFRAVGEAHYLDEEILLSIGPLAIQSS